MKPVRSARAPCTCPVYGAVPHQHAFRRFSAFVLFLAAMSLISGPMVRATPATAVRSQANNPPQIRIGQIYSGGGNANALYRSDFVELHNAGQTPVDITGWSLQYSQVGSSIWYVAPLSGMIPPGGYYLVSGYANTSCGGTPCGVPLPTADASNSIMNIVASGHAYLVAHQNTTEDVCRSGDDPAVVDMVGYGTNANCFEGDGPAPQPSNTTAALRADNACQDTNQNATDFTTGEPAPHNSASPALTCSVLAVSLATWEAHVTGSSVILRWETVSEFDNAGFHIYRAGSAEGPWVRVNSLLIPAALPGACAGAQYAWTDSQVSPGVTYWYMLEDVTLDGTATRHDPLAVTPAVPNAVGQVSVQAHRIGSAPGWLFAAGALGLAAAGTRLFTRAVRRK